MKMKALLVASAVVGSMLIAHHTAAARGLTKADHVVLQRAMVYVGQLATIFEKNIDKPDALISQLHRFVKRKGKKMQAVGAHVDKLRKSLDPNAKQTLKKKYAKHPAVARMKKAMMAVMFKHKDNKVFQQKLMGLVMKLQKRGKKKAPKKRAAEARPQ